MASIVGLCFSIGAFVQAGRASNAARQARDTTLIRTLADELEIASVRMDQLLDFLEHGRFAEAPFELKSSVEC